MQKFLIGFFFGMLVLCGAISFLIGALVPMFIPGVNWLCLGFAFVAFAAFAFFVKG